MWGKKKLPRENVKIITCKHKTLTHKTCQIFASVIFSEHAEKKRDLHLITMLVSAQVFLLLLLSAVLVLIALVRY